MTIDGEPASEWIDRQCDEKVPPFQVVHAYSAEHNNQGADLPCCKDDAKCPAVTQWSGIPRDNEGYPAVDVVHAFHQFLYIPGLRNDCNVVIDEAPDFSVDLAQDRIRWAVTAYLRAVGAPATTWEGLISLAEFDGGSSDASTECDELEQLLGETPDRERYINHPNAHALAPDLARAVYRVIHNEDLDANRRRSTTVLHDPLRFDDNDGGYGGNWLTVVLDDEYTVRTVRHAPDFSTARSVIGLDAHPSPPLWQRNVHPDMAIARIMDPDERRLWRRLERGLTVVQVGDATCPLSDRTLATGSRTTGSSTSSSRRCRSTTAASSRRQSRPHRSNRLCKNECPMPVFASPRPCTLARRRLGAQT